MALVLKDRVQETTTTSGTGTLTLTGAVSGFQTFSTAIGNGNTTYYTIFDNTAYVWEVGIGTVGAGTLARTTVLSNSSGTTSPITLAGNTAFVFVTYPAEKSINYDADGVATIGSTLGYTDTGIIASFASSVAGYNQVVLQNKSTATNASTNFNVSNDAGTAGSNYAELGINSSTFTGTGSFNIAGASYVASASTDLTLGTYGAYSIHFVTNSSTTDAMTIFNNGGISLGGFANPGIANMAASKFVPGYTAVTSAAGTTVLTASSNYYQNLLGTTTQTFQLPDATTLLEGTTFIFDNDSTGILTVVDNASGTVDTIPGGALGYVYLADNATVAGTWRRHAFLPASYDFNSSTANFGNATITNAVWNGTTIASGYGGTGLTTFTAANNALYSTSASNLVAGTLPVAAGGTGLTSLTAGYIPYGAGTSAFGSSANLFWDSANNYLGIGTNAPSQKLTISSNTTLPSVGAVFTSNIWSVGADASNNVTSFDSFGGNNNLLVRRANGTSASPSALLLGNVIFQFAARGYGATGYSTGGRAQFQFVAAENWTDTAQGTYISFNNTTNGTATSTEKLRILDSGAISFGSSGTAYGTSGQVLTSNGNTTPTWTTLAANVSSFQTSLSGLTPSTATTGAVTLAGTLGVASGGTGTSTAFTAGSVVFAGASGVYSQDNANFFWDDTNNRLGIGTATPSAQLNVYNATNSQLVVSSDGLTNVISARYSTDTSSPFITFRKGRGTTASPAAVANNDVLGQLIFQGFGGINNRNLAQIVGFVETYTSDTNISSGLAFNTSPSGSAAGTERMRITSTGGVSFGSSGTAFGTSGQALISAGNAPPTWGTLGIGAGGTGQTTASAAFNALSPITSTGDLIIGNGVNSATRLGIGTNGQILTSNGTTATWAAAPAAGVSSIAGTTNQITASAATGAVTLSTPSTFIAPGSIAATTTVTGTTINATQPFIVNSRTATVSYSIPAGSSATSAGPITVNSGVTITVPSGSRWVVL